MKTYTVNLLDKEGRIIAEGLTLTDKSTFGEIWQVYPDAASMDKRQESDADPIAQIFESADDIVNRRLQILHNVLGERD